MNPIAIGGFILSILVSLGSAFAIIYKAGILIGKIEATSDEFRKAMSDWKADRGKLGTIDLHGQRIGALEDTVRNLGARVETTWTKVFSHDRHIAVVRRDISHISHHDIDTKDDSEPPPKE